MFKILEAKKKNVIALKVDGKVKKEDYENITPVLENMIEEYGKIRCLAKVNEMHGVEPAALWEDLRLSLKHVDKFEKVAVVGAKPFIRSLSKLSSPFISADVKVYSENEIVNAMEWINK